MPGIGVQCERGILLRIVLGLGAILCLFPALAWGQSVGAIRGTVLDEDFGDPLAEARVTVQELGISVNSEEGGVYRIENVEPGVYTLVAAKPGFTRQIQRDVLVRAGEVATANIQLPQEVYELDELVVEAADLIGGDEVVLLELRQDTAALISSIGSETLSRAGASDAGDALKLVSGATVGADNEAVVRGLADRYTVTTLNSGRVPSANPEKRAVELDLFPTSLIESVNVSKTFTPELQGEATGGQVNIVTKSIPEGPIASFDAKVGYNSQTSGNPDFPTYDGAGENLGIDIEGNRGQPEGLPNSGPVGTATARTFTPVMGTTTKTPGPDFSFKTNVGNRYQIDDDQAVGFVFSLAYDKSYDSKMGAKRTIVDGDQTTGGTFSDETRSDFTYDEGVQKLKITSAFSLGYELNEDHNIQLNLIYSSNTEDTANIFRDTGTDAPEIGEGDGRDGDELITIVENVQHQERILAASQLTGESKFESLADLEMDYQFGYAYASQYTPDQRKFTEIVDTVNFPTTVYSVNTTTDTELDPTRDWQSVEDVETQGAVNFKIPFSSLNGTEGYFKSGVFASRRTRDFDVDFFRYDFRGPFDPGGIVATEDPFPGFFTLPPGTRLSDFFFTEFDPSQELERDSVRRGNDYNAEQRLTAVYAMAEFPITERLKLVGGARLERTEIDLNVAPDPNETVVPGPSVFAFVQIGPGQVSNISVPVSRVNTDLRESYVHPAATLIYEPLDDMFFRVAYSQTTARPTFRELAATQNTTIDGGRDFVGNPDLVMSRSENWDFRWEWFPRPTSLLSTSVFYKNIRNPIESTFVGTGGGDASTLETKVNFPSADVLGFEFEGRQSLGIFNDTLDTISVGGNFAWIESRVRVDDDSARLLIDDGVFESDRKLTGQPQYLANVDVTFSDPDLGTTASIFYTLQGETVLVGQNRAAIDANNLPAEVALPVGTLNVTLSQRITDYLTLAFSAKNLLNPKIETVNRLPNNPDIPLTTYREGIDLSLSAKVEW